MRRYPESWQDFETMFPNEQACRDYLVHFSGNAFSICPKCATVKKLPWITFRGLSVCGKCGHQASITAGTMFHRSHKPLLTWFNSFWEMVESEDGINAFALKRNLGLGSYHTALAWLSDFRQALQFANLGLLKGEIELGEYYLSNKLGKRQNKGLIVILIQKQDIGNNFPFRMQRFDNIPSPDFFSFIKNNVETGATIHTNAFSGYIYLKGLDYNHVIDSSCQKLGGDTFPRVKIRGSNFNMWLQKACKKRIKSSLLTGYIVEYILRRQKGVTRGKLFHQFVTVAASVKRGSNEKDRDRFNLL
jgi:hypothetical protein